MERQKINRQKTPEQALSSLMYLCSRAEKCSSDAVRLMYRWKIEPAEITKILCRLQKEKFIDDRRYAEAYVREKTRLSGWGVYKVARSLGAKGIDKKIINDVTSGLDASEMERKLLERLRRKLPAVKYNNRYELKGKIMRYGMSLGYGFDMVEAAVEKIMKELRLTDEK